MSACHDQANFRARYANKMEKVNSPGVKHGLARTFRLTRRTNQPAPLNRVDL